LNHLKQLGLALHNYHDAHQTFPPGAVHGQTGDPAEDASAFSWFVMILPMVEQAPLYQQLAPNNPRPLYQSLQDPAFRRLVQQPLSLMLCPSDPSPIQNTVREFDVQGTRYRLGSSNYLGSHGTTLPFPGDGIFDHNTKVRIADITDGTSNTFLVGERTFQRVVNAFPDPAGSVWVGTLEWPSVCSASDVGPFLVVGSATFKLTSGISAANANIACPSSGFGSRHPGVSQFALADGSVRTISVNINSVIGAPISDVAQWGVYQRLARRDDRLPVGEF